MRSLRSESSAAALSRSGSKSPVQIFVVSQRSPRSTPDAAMPAPDLGLVLVRARGVDVAVADLERVADAVGGVLPGDLPRAEAEPRDLGALDREDAVVCQCSCSRYPMGPLDTARRA